VGNSKFSAVVLAKGFKGAVKIANFSEFVAKSFAKK